MFVWLKNIIHTIPEGVISKVAICSFVAGFIVAMVYFIFGK